MRPRADDLVVTRWGARFHGRRMPCAVGRGGILPAAAKKEGDGATPAGAHRLVALLARADRVGQLPQGIRPIGPRDGWCEDPGDPDYNRLVRDAGGDRLRRGDPLYDIIGVLDWNWRAPEPGRGSAIFLHLWRGPRRPTAGCVAFRRRDLLWLLRHWQPWSRVIVQP